MQEPEFVSFQKFNVEKQAHDLADLLDKHKIEYEFEDGSPTLDASFGNTELSKEFIIKLKKEDFRRVDNLLLESAVNDLDSIDKDYYLFGFSNEELREVVINKDEWNPFDFLLAQKLLKEKGSEISVSELELLRQQRLQALAKPEKRQTGWIVAGYIFALLGGLLGIFIGWFLVTHKKTLPNGERVYNYSEPDRKHGSLIIRLSIVVIVLQVIYQVYEAFCQKA